ncbi:DUF6233 domain-containing protein [Streptomyces sp. DSM 118148]|uniref:DUF6233 domain-containing protein n=1 Tax=Streptomyces sp. DSM 118148 TaxID=3448667 RepID=UPI00403FFFCB
MVQGVPLLRPGIAQRVAVPAVPAPHSRWQVSNRDPETPKEPSIRKPPQPWHGLNRTNVDAVHTGECWTAAKSGRCRPATRQQVVEALRQQVPTCVHYRPDTALGILD